jgi:rhamnogalacturonan endolyase
MKMVLSRLPYPLRSRFIGVRVAMLLAVALVLGTGVTFQSARADSLAPRLVRKISFGPWGGQVLRFGDLDGDGEPEVLAVQSKGQFITSLAAFSIDGRLLWTKGRPSRRNQSVASDLPVQLFDWNRDGRDEIVLIRNFKLQILRGTDGKILKQVAVSGKDSLHIFAVGKKFNLLAKDRYRRVWAFDDDLNLLWSKQLNTGHFPLSVDLDQDKKDELLIGFGLYDHQGRRQWERKFDLHCDAVDVGDMDGDGNIEIAMATSSKSVLLTESGATIWEKAHGHSQHAALGDFLNDESSTLQVAFVDRRAKGSVFIYDYSGNLQGTIAEPGNKTIISTVDGWTGRNGESLLLLYRRPVGPPALFNGRGELVVEFPFPLAQRGDSYEPHYVQHFDALGDGREEILVSNSEELLVYENAEIPSGPIEVSEGLPNKRIYNASFYSGFQ